MTRARDTKASRGPRERRSRQVRLPGFVVDEAIGLGDAIKRATSYAGIRPCGGCEHRAAALNRWLVFTRRPHR
jgi:hypothetical protein